MAWVESASASFRARHDSARRDEAGRLLESLERTRERLAELFPRAVDDVTIVLHGGMVSLSFANPMVLVQWFVAAPAARRYLAGRWSRDELHVLAPSVLKTRASNVPGSREMLELSASALYARQVVAVNNQELSRARGPHRLALELRWTWLLDGAASWFSGQSEHARPAIARRLREGGPPAFPPGRRDAPLLGASVIDLLVREQGERAAARFVCRLHRGGPRAALAAAFDDRTEQAWRTHLLRIAGPATAAAPDAAASERRR
jgi:hypothetical protein